MSNFFIGLFACISGTFAALGNSDIRSAYWKLALALLAMSIVLSVAGYWAADHWIFESWSNEAPAQAGESWAQLSRWTSELGSWGMGFLKFLVTLVIIVLSSVTAFFAVNLLFPMFNDAILMAAIRSESPTLAAQLEGSKGLAWHVGIAHTLKRFFLLALITLPLFLLSWLPVVGVILIPILQWGVTAYFLSWELAEPYFSRRQLSWAQQREFVESKRGAMLGFGTPAAGMLAIPIIGPLFFALAQAAAARLIVRAFEAPSTTR